MAAKDSRINMQSIFDGERIAHRKLGSGSSEVVKKLSFQLGCQSQEEEVQTTRSTMMDQELPTHSLLTHAAVAIAEELTLNNIENVESNEEAQTVPMPRHQYNRSHLVLSGQIDKEDMEKENELIYESLRSRRRYQLWRGNNVFLCYGRLMLGVHIGHLSLSVSLITGLLYHILLAMTSVYQYSQC